MMNFIRQKLKFLMWFVAIFFVGGLFFVGGRSVGLNWLVNVMPVGMLAAMPGCARSAGIIMKVGNYNVKRDEILRVRENTIAAFRQQYKDNFDTYARNIDFNQRAQESVTRYALLLQEANKRKIYISKTEVQKGIREFPYYMPEETLARVNPVPYYMYSRMQDGKFNANIFNFLLAREGKITPEEFSKEVENGLRIARLKTTLYEAAMVTDLELQQEYRKQNEKVKIKYVEFPYRDFTDDVQFDDAELNQFFQKNILDYKSNDKVNIEFVKIDPKEFENRITIPEEEIASYYNAHKEEDYLEPEKVDAIHILVSIDPDASSEDKTKAKAYADEILEEAKKPGADFSALADIYNKDPFTVKYEDLGLFERGKMVRSYGETFEQKAFDLELGTVSDVIETSSGYHIMKVEDKKPSQIKPLGLVRNEIARMLKENEASVQARQKAEDIQYTIMSEEELQAAVDANPDLNLKIQKTGLFAKDEFIPQIGLSFTYRSVAEEAFNLEVGEISSLVEVKSYGDRILGYFIFKLIDQKPGGIPKLEDVKSNVIKNLKEEKARTLAMQEAVKVVSSRESSADLDKIAQENELKVGESEPFSLSERGYIRGKPGSVNSKDAMFNAFSMEVGQIEGPFEGASSAYIIQLTERDKFEEDQEEMSKLRTQLLREKQQRIYDTWYQKIRQQARIQSFIPETS